MLIEKLRARILKYLLRRSSFTGGIQREILVAGITLRSVVVKII